MQPARDPHGGTGRGAEGFHLVFLASPAAIRDTLARMLAGPPLRDLPPDGTVPGPEGWQWIHTPGHAPGHVSFWHAATATLIAGDAISATRQESLSQAILQTPHLQGPPAYFTPDWIAAGHSLRRLAALRPRRMIPGHGQALAGPDFQAALDRLAEDFESRGTPALSRYACEGDR